MTKLTDTATILNELKQRPNHQLGQNFLINEAVVNQIVAAGFAPFAKDRTALITEVDPRRRVLEIGPGLGVLTAGIINALPAGGQLLAVEKDHKLATNLSKQLHHPRALKVINSDVLVFDRTYHYQAGEFMVMANLPFNISTFVVNSFLTTEPRPARLVLMLQQEVAERVLAPAGHSSRGLLSVIVEYYTNGTAVCQVPCSDFYPQPKVDATVIKLDLRQPLTNQDQALFKLVKAGFAQRRKTLVNSLTASYGPNKDTIVVALDQAGIAAQARAQDLTLAQWQKLQRALSTA